MRLYITIYLVLFSIIASAQCTGFPATIVDQDCGIYTPLSNNTSVNSGDTYGACNTDALFNSFSGINLQGGIIRICGNTSISGNFNGGTIIVSCGSTLKLPSGLTLNRDVGIINYGTIIVTGDLICQNDNSYIYNESIDSRIEISGKLEQSQNTGTLTFIKNNGYISVGTDFNPYPGGFTCLGPGSTLVCKNINYQKNCGDPDNRFTYSGGSSNAIVQYTGNATIRANFTASTSIEVFSVTGASAINDGGCGSWGSAPLTTNTTIVAAPAAQTNCAIQNCFTIALPIELLDFSVKTENNIVRLDWATASEIDNDFFTIEKSRDGINWHTLKKVNGSGNSNQILYYTDYDFNHLPGTSYYRLKQTDYDHKSTYSSIETIHNITDDVGIYPNPAQNKITITGSATSIELVNMLGEIVFKQEITNNEQDIILSELPEGTYFARIIQYTNVVTKKIIIQSKP